MSEVGIEASVAEANEELQAPGTPTIIVNGTMLGANRDSLYIGELIERATR